MIHPEKQKGGRGRLSPLASVRVLKALAPSSREREQPCYDTLPWLIFVSLGDAENASGHASESQQERAAAYYQRVWLVSATPAPH
jgi:hypothetical protein